jgi:hypothetical protein
MRSGARLLPKTIGRPIRRGLRDQLALPRADMVYVSYPKSGRTWVRVMVSRLYRTHFGLPGDDILEFDNLHQRDPRIPKILFTHDGEPWRRPEQLDADKSPYATKKVMLLVRNPIDVAVSRYFHVRNRARELRHKEYAAMPIGEFVWAPLGGLPTIVAYMNDWDRARRALPDLLVQRYEDFRRDPGSHLAQLATFIGIGSSADEIADAVSFASFENLRKLEEQRAIATSRLGARQEGNPDSLKVRRGKVGGYRDYFTAEEVARMETFVRERLSPSFGYYTEKTAE